MYENWTRIRSRFYRSFIFYNLAPTTTDWWDFQFSPVIKSLFGKNEGTANQERVEHLEVEIM